MTPSERSALQRAVDLVGGPTKLAGLIGTSPQRLYGYRMGHFNKMPAQLCEAIEKATNGAVKRQELLTYPWKEEDE